MRIRKALWEDLEAVEAVYDSVLQKEEESGPYCNWKRGLYPTGQTARQALEEDGLYVLEENGLVCATAILNQEEPACYAQISWTMPAREKEIFVIHTLCVRTDQAGKGYARAFVAYAEEEARKRGCKVVRLDTYEGNQRAAALYTALGYRNAGLADLHFMETFWEKIICFEKSVSSKA